MWIVEVPPEVVVAVGILAQAKRVLTRGRRLKISPQHVYCRAEIDIAEAGVNPDRIDGDEALLQSSPLNYAAGLDYRPALL